MKKRIKLLKVFIISLVLIMLVLALEFYRENSVENFCQQKIQREMKTDNQTDWNKQLQPPANINWPGTISLGLSKELQCQDSTFWAF